MHSHSLVICYQTLQTTMRHHNWLPKREPSRLPKHEPVHAVLHRPVCLPAKLFIITRALKTVQTSVGCLHKTMQPSSNIRGFPALRYAAPGLLAFVYNHFDATTWVTVQVTIQVIEPAEHSL